MEELGRGRGKEDLTTIVTTLIVSSESKTLNLKGNSNKLKILPKGEIEKQKERFMSILIKVLFLSRFLSLVFAHWVWAKPSMSKEQKTWEHLKEKLIEINIRLEEQAKKALKWNEIIIHENSAKAILKMKGNWAKSLKTNRSYSKIILTLKSLIRISMIDVEIVHSPLITQHNRESTQCKLSEVWQFAAKLSIGWWWRQIKSSPCSWVDGVWTIIDSFCKRLFSQFICSKKRAKMQFYSKINRK